VGRSARRGRVVLVALLSVFALAVLGLQSRAPSVPPAAAAPAEVPALTPVEAPAPPATATSVPAPTHATPPALTPAAAPTRTIHNPYAGAGVFRKAQFHLHTSNSFDGHEAGTPEETARAFKEAGFGFVVFTDHDRASVAELNDKTFLAATGYESTGADGHIGAFFTNVVVDPRWPAQRRIDAIRSAGGLATLNHPDYTVGFRAQQMLELSDFQFLEIYNHITTPVDGKLRENLAANLEKWRQLVERRGRERPVWGIAVSDAHDGSTGGGWTVVKTAEVSVPALKEALLRGAMYGSTGADFRSLDVVDGVVVVEADAPSRVRFVDQDGRVVQEEQGFRSAYRPDEETRWVRVELLDGAGGMAWSQPFWID
jgi:hypothetical protein